MAQQPECCCPVTYTLSVVGGKWKWFILWVLARDGVKRYGQLKKDIPAITHKMLSQQLKELEATLLVSRHEYHQVPPKVEYALTDKGLTLIPIFELMYQWGDKNRPPDGQGR